MKHSNHLLVFCLGASLLFNIVSCTPALPTDEATSAEAKAELEKARAEADAARAQAEIAKAQADAVKADAEAAKKAAERSIAKVEDRSAPVAQQQVDPVSSFKQLIRRTHERLDGLVAVRYNKGKKCWSKFRIALTTPEFDVKQSNSLVAPYTGVLSFNVQFQHVAQEFATEDDAQEGSDVFQPAINSSPMYVDYAYSDGEWVYQRSLYNLIPGTTEWKLPSDYFADPVETTIKSVAAE